MNEVPHSEEQALTPWQQHRFLVMIAGAVMVACFLVSVALGLYNSSGAAQVDLSRPAYEAIRNQAAQDKDDKSFAATGELDDKAMADFEALYEARASKVTGVDSFDEEALSEDSLQLMTRATSTDDN